MFPTWYKAQDFPQHSLQLGQAHLQVQSELLLSVGDMKQWKKEKEYINRWALWWILYLFLIIFYSNLKVWEIFFLINFLESLFSYYYV